MLNGKRILITGGTGSFGRAMGKLILDRYSPSRLIIYSRDELKQFEMAHAVPFADHPEVMRFFIGDVRDCGRLKRAMEGVDLVVHAAALKQVPACEYNPFEAVKTNVLGAQNVIDAAMAAGVPKVVALSTDKAAAPINLYGATKLCSDKLFTASNNFAGGRDYVASVVRYGNVMGSRGSVIPFFLRQREQGVLTITDEHMTRFNITLDEACEMVLFAAGNAIGGEIFVPKIPSYRILELAEAIAPSCRTEIVGIRPGEKIHEEMITASDSYTTVDLGKYYAILPTGDLTLTFQRYEAHEGACFVEPGMSVNSGTNNRWLSVEELRTLIRQHVDAEFRAL